MKNPFEFAKELLRYSRGELSEVEKESVEEMLSKVKGLDELAEELKDKKRVENELRVVESFDVEKALVRLRKGQYGRRRLLLSWVAVASVVVVAGIFAFFKSPPVEPLLSWCGHNRPPAAPRGRRGPR